MKNVLFLILPTLFCLTIFAQNELEKITNLFSQGKDQEAISLLESRTNLNPKDAESWNLLGLVYFQQKNYVKSQKAFEKAVKFNSQSEIYQTNLAIAFAVSKKTSKSEKAVNNAIKINPKYAKAYFVRGNLHLAKGNYDKGITDAETAINIDSAYTDAYVLKADAQIYKISVESEKNQKNVSILNNLKNAKLTLEKCLQVCKNNLNLAKEKLEMFTAFVDYFSVKKDDDIFSQAEPQDSNVTPLTILSRPKPSYTNEARQNGVTGTVRLALYFSSEGFVKYILVIKPLKNGLTENSIKAAKGIKFEPKKVDGKPVSVVKIVEFGFSIY